MEITFATARLQKTMNSGKELKKQFGDKGARRIQSRLSDLGAAETLEDMRLLPGRCHELTGDLDGLLALDLHHPYRLLFRPAEPAPLKPDGGLDWTEVVSIVVTDVVDYH